MAGAARPQSTAVKNSGPTQRNAREACTCKSKSSSRPVMRVTTDERREGGSTARRAGRDSRTGVSRSEFVPTARHEAQGYKHCSGSSSSSSSTTGGSGRDRPSMHAGREENTHAIGVQQHYYHYAAVDFRSSPFISLPSGRLPTHPLVRLEDSSRPGPVLTSSSVYSPRRRTVEVETTTTTTTTTSLVRTRPCTVLTCFLVANLPAAPPPNYTTP